MKRSSEVPFVAWQSLPTEREQKKEVQKRFEFNRIKTNSEKRGPNNFHGCCCCCCYVVVGDSYCSTGQIFLLFYVAADNSDREFCRV